MTVPTFQIDASTLSIQPSEIQVMTAAAQTSQVMSGGYIATTQPKGTVIRVTWGVDVVDSAILNELRTKRNGLIAHTITFYDPYGTSHTYKVLWLQDPPYTFRVDLLLGKFTIEFMERPD